MNLTNCVNVSPLVSNSKVYESSSGALKSFICVSVSDDRANVAVIPGLATADCRGSRELRSNTRTDKAQISLRKRTITKQIGSCHPKKKKLCLPVNIKKCNLAKKSSLFREMNDESSFDIGLSSTNIYYKDESHHSVENKCESIITINEENKSIIKNSDQRISIFSNNEDKQSKMSNIENSCFKTRNTRKNQSKISNIINKSSETRCSGNNESKNRNTELNISISSNNEENESKMSNTEQSKSISIYDVESDTDKNDMNSNLYNLQIENSQFKPCKEEQEHHASNSVINIPNSILYFHDNINSNMSFQRNLRSRTHDVINVANGGDVKEQSLLNLEDNENERCLLTIANGCNKDMSLNNKGYICAAMKPKRCISEESFDLYQSGGISDNESLQIMNCEIIDSSNRECLDIQCDSQKDTIVVSQGDVNCPSSNKRDTCTRNKVKCAISRIPIPKYKIQESVIVTTLPEDPIKRQMDIDLDRSKSKSLTNIFLETTDGKSDSQLISVNNISGRYSLRNINNASLDEIYSDTKRRYCNEQYYGKDSSLRRLRLLKSMPNREDVIYPVELPRQSRGTQTINKETESSLALIGKSARKDKILRIYNLRKMKNESLVNTSDENNQLSVEGSSINEKCSMMSFSLSSSCPSLGAICLNMDPAPLTNSLISVHKSSRNRKKETIFRKYDLRHKNESLEAVTESKSKSIQPLLEVKQSKKPCSFVEEIISIEESLKEIDKNTKDLLATATNCGKATRELYVHRHYDLRSNKSNEDEGKIESSVCRDKSSFKNQSRSMKGFGIPSSEDLSDKRSNVKCKMFTNDRDYSVLDLTVSENEYQEKRLFNNITNASFDGECLEDRECHFNEINLLDNEIKHGGHTCVVEKSSIIRPKKISIASEGNILKFGIIPTTKILEESCVAGALDNILPIDNGMKTKLNRSSSAESLCTYQNISGIDQQDEMNVCQNSYSRRRSLSGGSYEDKSTGKSRTMRKYEIVGRKYNLRNRQLINNEEEYPNMSKNVDRAIKSIHARCASPIYFFETYQDSSDHHNSVTLSKASTFVPFSDSLSLCPSNCDNTSMENITCTMQSTQPLQITLPSLPLNISKSLPYQHSTLSYCHLSSSKSDTESPNPMNISTQPRPCTPECSLLYDREQVSIPHRTSPNTKKLMSNSVASLQDCGPSSSAKERDSKFEQRHLDVCDSISYQELLAERSYLESTRIMSARKCNQLSISLSPIVTKVASAVDPSKVERHQSEIFDDHKEIDLSSSDEGSVLCDLDEEDEEEYNVACASPSHDKVQGSFYDKLLEMRNNTVITEESEGSENSEESGNSRESSLEAVSEMKNSEATEMPLKKAVKFMLPINERISSSLSTSTVHEFVKENVSFRSECPNETTKSNPSINKESSVMSTEYSVNESSFHEGFTTFIAEKKINAPSRSFILSKVKRNLSFVNPSDSRRTQEGIIREKNKRTRAQTASIYDRIIYEYSAKDKANVISHREWRVSPRTIRRRQQVMDVINNTRKKTRHKKKLKPLEYLARPSYMNMNHYTVSYDGVTAFFINPDTHKKDERKLVISNEEYKRKYLQFTERRRHELKSRCFSRRLLNSKSDTLLELVIGRGRSVPVVDVVVDECRLRLRGSQRRLVIPRDVWYLIYNPHKATVHVIESVPNND